MRSIEKFAYLGSIDHLWIDHLDTIDGIEDAVKLRGYAQKNPLSECMIIPFRGQVFYSL